MSRQSQRQSQLAICQKCKPQTLQLEFSDKYNLINAYNLGILAILSYENVLLAKTDKNGNKEAKTGNELFAYFLNTLNKKPSVGKGFKPVIKSVDKKEDAYTFAQGFDINSSNTAKRSVECGFAYDKDSAFIFVRGTQEYLDDVRVDLDARMVEFTEGRGHVSLGFYSQFKALIESKVFTDFKDNVLPKKPKIYLAGHSLGGAVATLVAAYLLEEGFKVLLYTYGSPRVGTEEFLQGYHPITHYRHVNDDDLVPMVPARWTQEGVNFLDEKAFTTTTSRVIANKYYAIATGVVKFYKMANITGEAYIHHGTLVQISLLGGEPILFKATSNSLVLAQVVQLVRKEESLGHDVDAEDVRQAYREVTDDSDQSLSLTSGANHSSLNYVANIKTELLTCYELFEKNGCIQKTVKSCGWLPYTLRYSNMRKNLYSFLSTAKKELKKMKKKIKVLNQNHNRSYSYLNGSSAWEIDHRNTAKLISALKEEIENLEEDLLTLDEIYSQTYRINAKRIVGKAAIPKPIQAQLDYFLKKP